MRQKILILIVLFSSSSMYCQSKNIKLSLGFKAGFKDFMTLKVQNNSATEVQVPSIIDGSFWCFTKPCVKLKLEENINGSWTKINYDVFNNKRCGHVSDWKKINNKTTVKPGEEKVIGTFNFPNNMSGWFGFFGNKKLRLTAEYSVNGDKALLSKYGYNKIKLTSIPLKIDYVNTKHPVDYVEFYNQLLINNKLTKKRFRQGAKTIVYPGSKEQRMLLALKAFGVKINNVNNKIVPHSLNGYTTDKTNPAIILAKVINDNGKFYLVAFIRHSRYGLETEYTKDFCKVYRIN